MKFNIGDKLHISGDIEITGEQSHNNGSYSYNTNTGVAFPAYVLEKLVCTAASVKPYAEPTEPAEPAFSWDAFKAGKIAVHCDTEEKAKAFLKECEERGLKWWTGSDICAFIRTHLADKSGLWFAHNSDGLRWFSSVESKMPESRYTIIDYPFSATPANKYDAMSDDDLVFAICDMGTCSAAISGRRHADCPLKNTPAYNSPTTKCTDFLHAHPEFRPVLVRYLADEDAAKEPKPEPKPVKHLYSGKVVCVETHDDFTVGKVYTFKDGKVTDDSWTRRPMSSFVAESLEDWNIRCGDCIVRFVEYKGEA